MKSTVGSGQEGLGEGMTRCRTRRWPRSSTLLGGHMQVRVGRSFRKCFRMLASRKKAENRGLMGQR